MAATPTKTTQQGYPAFTLGGIPHVLDTPEAHRDLEHTHGYHIVFISQEEWNRLERALAGRHDGA